MSPLLHGRVALVSGIGPGMGRDITLTLAGAGADVVLVARRSDVVATVADEARALGRTVLPVAADIADPDAWKGVARQVRTQFGAVHVLVNNAFAEESWDDFTGLDVARWRQPFDVNVHGTLGLTQALVPLMDDSGGGSIIMITTLSTRVINPVLGGYSASKFALDVASKALAQELGPHQIRVNCVAPGHIWGRALENYFAWQAAQRGTTARHVYDGIAGQNPLNHIPTSEEVSRAVLFLASDLSRVITGQTLDVNCGRYLH